MARGRRAWRRRRGDGPVRLAAPFSTRPPTSSSRSRAPRRRRFSSRYRRWTLRDISTATTRTGTAVGVPGSPGAPYSRSMALIAATPLDPDFTFLVPEGEKWKMRNSFLEKFSRDTGVQAWETHLNEISANQKHQSKQIADLTKAVQTAEQTVLNRSPGDADPSKGSRLQGSYASVAARVAEPSPAIKTVHTWTSVTGTTYREYLTKMNEREITIKLHNSSRDDGKPIKSWLQGSLKNNSQALINHINQAIHQGATEPPPGPSARDLEMADTNITPPEELPPRPFSGIQVHSAIFLKSGDIQVHTTFVAQAKLLIEHADQWVKPKDMALQLQTLNAGTIQHDKITYMGWLTKKGVAKPMSSIIVEFSQPEPANRLIHSGCLWSSESHTV
ncbi:ATP-binding cassette- subfamily F- member 3 [Apiospora arundinis]